MPQSVMRQQGRPVRRLLSAPCLLDQHISLPGNRLPAVFFPEKDTVGNVLDYRAAISGGLQLVPAVDALTKLAVIYQHMVDDGLFLDAPEPFERLLERWAAI